MTQFPLTALSILLCKGFFFCLVNCMIECCIKIHVSLLGMGFCLDIARRWEFIFQDQTACSSTVLCFCNQQGNRETRMFALQFDKDALFSRGQRLM